jgi:hypothetical protein
MRTTLTLDADVARLLEDEVHRTRKALKQVVNDAIRRGLAPSVRSTPVSPYKVKAHVAKLAAGIDPTRMNALVDELEDAEILAKMSRASRAAERKR